MIASSLIPCRSSSRIRRAAENAVGPAVGFARSPTVGAAPGTGSVVCVILGIPLCPTVIGGAVGGTLSSTAEVQRFSRHADVRVLQRYDDNREDLSGEVAREVAATL